MNGATGRKCGAEAPRYLTAAIIATMWLGIAPVSAETMVVSPSGPFRSLGDAVRSAPAGSHIVVRGGTYREHPMVIDRPLTIAGEGRPVIEPTTAGTLIRVVADGVTLRGLVLAHISPSHVEDRAAVKFEGVRHCVADSLEVQDAPYGIYASKTSDCRFVNNVVRGGGSGRQPLGNALHLWSAQRMTVTGNVVTGHRDGLYFEFVEDATVDRNTSERNTRYGLHFMFSNRCAYRDNRLAANGAGVAVMYSRGVTMERNVFDANRGATAYGLLLKDIGESRLEGNRFSDNTVGLLIEGGGDLTVTRNHFTGNGWAVKLMANSPRNRFEGNVFGGNSFDMATNSRSTDAAIAGNWWDRYDGFDLDRDGRGDVAFRPVRLFSLLVASHPPSVILMRSTFVDLLDAAERALPVLTPETLVDRSPLMAVPR
jgi:nitrous oxidase accessory protein